jgi:hypothetical protein
MSEEPEHLAFGDAERDAVDRADRAVALLEVVDLDGGVIYASLAIRRAVKPAVQSIVAACTDVT